MNSSTILQRLRLFLLVLAGLTCIGTVIELWLTEHLEGTVQLIPFALSGIGLCAILVVLIRPQRGSLLFLRGIMLLMILGSLFGIYEHLEHNLEFELEIRPNAVASDVFMEALSGANPLLAPGILGMAGTLAIAATYYHPAFGER